MSPEPPLEPISHETRRFAAIDNLRAFLALLVVAQHAALAYVSFAPLPFTGWSQHPMAWRAFPVVDTARAPALDILVGFNDAFFMSLFFLIAGLFTWRSLAGKGGLRYLQSRVSRLGIPFLVGAAIVAPIAYYPAYLQHQGEPGLAAYTSAWLNLDVWPSGPVWFLWVLLALSLLTALSYQIAPTWGARLGRALHRIGARPVALFGLLFAISAVLYLPIAMLIDPQSWFQWGPLAVQTSRVVHYALYFVVGVGLGAGALAVAGRAGHLSTGLLAAHGPLARHWSRWVGLAMVSFAALGACVVAFFDSVKQGAPNLQLVPFLNVGFALSCAASSFMFMALFARFGHWAGKLWSSLGASAYGIYIFHYMFVNWAQWTVLDVALPAGVKFVLVFVSAALLSWLTTIAVRRIPGVAKIL